MSDERSAYEYDLNSPNDRAEYDKRVMKAKQRFDALIKKWPHSRDPETNRENIAKRGNLVAKGILPWALMETCAEHDEKVLSLPLATQKQKAVEAIKEALQHPVPADPGYVPSPGRIYRMDDPEVQANLRKADEIDGLHQLAYEAATERLLSASRERASREKAGSSKGGSTKARNTKERVRKEREYMTEKNRPRREALDAFRTQHPDCTLPEAAAALSERLPGLPRDAAKKWLTRSVDGGAIPQFAAGRPGRPRNRK